MRKSRLAQMLKFHFIGLYFIASTSFAQTWQQLEDFPGTPRDDGSCFVIDSFVYTGLGRDSGFSCMRDFYRYNAVTMTWSDCADLPVGEERQYAVAISKNGLGYVFGGAKCDGSFCNDLWEYNPTLNSWSALAPMPDDGRGGSVHFVLGDTLYLVGGKNQQGILTEVWGYDFTTNQWSQKNALPGNGIWRGTSFEFNEFGYVGLGRNNLNGQTELNTEFYQYNPVTQQWQVYPNPGISPRCYIGTARANHLVSFFGGLDASNTILNDFQVLDLSNWTLAASVSFVSTPRKGTMSFAFGPDFYVTTGITNTERFKETWRISNVLALVNPKQDECLVYPNPCADVLTVFTHDCEDITIHDLDGRIVFSVRVLAPVTYVDVSQLPNGMYILSSKGVQRYIDVHH
jgi:N-acetylneuraminic acid mutarotase